MLKIVNHRLQGGCRLCPAAPVAAAAHANAAATAIAPCSPAAPATSKVAVKTLMPSNALSQAQPASR